MTILRVNGVNFQETGNSGGPPVKYSGVNKLVSEYQQPKISNWSCKAPLQIRKAEPVKEISVYDVFFKPIKDDFRDIPDFQTLEDEIKNRTFQDRLLEQYHENKSFNDFKAYYEHFTTDAKVDRDSQIQQKIQEFEDKLKGLPFPEKQKEHLRNEFISDLYKSDLVQDTLIYKDIKGQPLDNALNEIFNMQERGPADTQSIISKLTALDLVSEASGPAAGGAAASGARAATLENLVDDLRSAIRARPEIIPDISEGLQNFKEQGTVSSLGQLKNLGFSSYFDVVGESDKRYKKIKKVSTRRKAMAADVLEKMPELQ